MAGEKRPKKQNEFRRLYLAGCASMAGFRYACKNEAAFRLELCLTLIAPVSVILISGSYLKTAIVLSVWILVLVVEVLNTAIETIVDRISLERHPLSGAAKDLGSFAVLLTTLNALIWWAYALLS